jgi:hypothetical protein
MTAHPTLSRTCAAEVTMNANPDLKGVAATRWKGTGVAVWKGRSRDHRDGEESLDGMQMEEGSNDNIEGAFEAGENG